MTLLGSTFRILVLQLNGDILVDVEMELLLSQLISSYSIFVFQLNGGHPCICGNGTAPWPTHFLVQHLYPSANCCHPGCMLTHFLFELHTYSYGTYGTYDISHNSIYVPKFSHWHTLQLSQSHIV